jgi:hypothetical protein
MSIKMLIFSSFCSALILSAQEKAPSQLSLGQALENKSVRLQVTFDEHSPHYKYPMLVRIENLREEFLELKIDPGDIFRAESELTQDMVITEKRLVKLKGKEQCTLNLAAMCISPERGAGARESRYYFEPSSDSIMKAFAAYIAEKKYQNTEAQHAVWALVSKQPVTNIYGPDTTIVLALQQKLAALRKEVLPLWVQPQEYRYNYFATEMAIELSGYFEYDIAKSRSIEVAMFNEGGVLVRELLRKHVSNSGKHRFDYSFDATIFEEDVYYVKLIMDDKIMLQRKIPLGQVRGSWRY